MFPDITRDDVFRIETRRLWLRWPEAGDQKTLSSFKNLSVVKMSLQPEETAAAYINRVRYENEKGHIYTACLTLKDASRTLIGVIRIELPKNSQPSLSYGLAEPWRGKGYGTEAINGLLDVVFSYTAQVQVVATLETDDPNVRRVYEDCGFERDLLTQGLLHPAFRLDRRDWRGFARHP